MYTNLLSKFDNICRVNDFERYKVSGVSAFPLFRRQIQASYIKENIGTLETNHREIKGKDFVGLVKCLFRSIFDIFHLMKIENRKYLFLGFSRRVYDKRNDAYKDKFHDPIIDALSPEDCLMIERPFNLSHYPKRSTKCRIVNVDAIVYFSILFGFLAFPVYRLFFGQDIGEFCSRVNVAFKCKCLDRNKATIKYIAFLAEKKIYKFLLKKKGISKVIMTSRWLHYPIIGALNNTNIEFIELQHGAILKKNIFYREFDEAEFGIDTMLVFSDYWKNSRTWNARRVIAVGRETTVLIDDSVFYKNRVLCISQPELNYDLNRDLFGLAKANPGVKFDVKLHPQDVDQYEKRYPDLIRLDNVFFISNKSLDVLTIIKRYPLIIGYYSTVLFDAYDLGCKVSFIFNDKFTSNMYFRLMGSAYRKFGAIYSNQVLLLIEENRQENKNFFFEDLKLDLVKKVLNEKNN